MQICDLPPPAYWLGVVIVMLRRIGGVLSSLMVGVAAEASGSAAPTLGSVWTWGILSSMWYETSLWILAAVCAYCLVVVGINTGWLPEPEERRRTRIHEAVLKVFSALCFIQEERFLKVMLPEVAKLPYGGAATQVGETGASRFVWARPARPESLCCGATLPPSDAERRPFHLSSHLHSCCRYKAWSNPLLRE